MISILSKAATWSPEQPFGEAFSRVFSSRLCSAQLIWTAVITNGGTPVPISTAAQLRLLGAELHLGASICGFAKGRVTNTNGTDEGSAYGIPPFTEPYHRARKLYTLSSALLMAWEWLGLQTKDNDWLKVTTQNEEAAPLVLVVLILFFAWRTAVEWLQCSPSRRGVLIARADYYAANGIAVSALFLYSYQWVSGFLVADVFGARGVLGATILMVIAFSITLSAPNLWSGPLAHRLLVLGIFAIILLLPFADFMVGGGVFSSAQRALMYVGVIVGLILGATILYRQRVVV